MDALIVVRDAELERTTYWETARWEIAALDAQANLYDETQHQRAAWPIEWQRQNLLLKLLCALAFERRRRGAPPPAV